MDVVISTSNLHSWTQKVSYFNFVRRIENATNFSKTNFQHLCHDIGTYKGILF